MQILRDNLRASKTKYVLPRRHVVLTGTAFSSFLRYANDGASFRQPREKWVMAMGWLFCRHQEDKYIIADAMGVVYGNGMYVETTPTTFERVKEYETTHPGTFLGGWTCSRPGIGLFASDTDLHNQLFYQQTNEKATNINHSVFIIS